MVGFVDGSAVFAICASITVTALATSAMLAVFANLCDMLAGLARIKLN